MFSNKLFKIAKLLISRKFYYYIKLKDQITFLNNNKYPLYTVLNKSENEYILFEINSFKEILNKFNELSIPKESLKRIIKKDFEIDIPDNQLNSYLQISKNQLIDILKNHKKDFLSTIGNINFNRIDKNRLNLYVKSQHSYNAEQLFSELSKKIEFSIGDFETHFGVAIDFNNKNNNGLYKFDYKKWKIISSDNIINKDDIKDILDQIENKLGNKFNFLCYGIVEFVKNITNAAADYTSEKDYIRVNTKNSKEEIIRYFIHELGHRLYDRYLSEHIKERIKTRYNFTKNKKFRTGDKLINNDGEKFIFLKYENGKILCKSVIDNKHYYITFDSIKKVNGIDFVNVPTSYSLKNEEEFFAELFSLYIINNLDKNLKTWLNNIL